MIRVETRRLAGVRRIKSGWRGSRIPRIPTRYRIARTSIAGSAGRSCGSG